MLRLYKPIISHEIFKLQGYLEDLVINVWCKADSESPENKLNEEFKEIYNSYKQLKDKIDSIYSKCQVLTEEQKGQIKNAFITNNKIQEICDGLLPIEQDVIPESVRKELKELMIYFYDSLLDLKKVPGTKKDFYEKLMLANHIKSCPACGLYRVESWESKDREPFDHYLPKSKYPFASVNFLNLIPICHKCNSNSKKTKNPISKFGKAFYPYSQEAHNIKLKVKWNKDLDFFGLTGSNAEIPKKRY